MPALCLRPTGAGAADGALPSEQAVRERVRELNHRVVDWLKAPTGPVMRIGPVNADQVVARWRTDRRLAVGSTAGATTDLGPYHSTTRDGAARDGAVRDGASGDDRPPWRIRWWRRIGRAGRE